MKVKNKPSTPKPLESFIPELSEPIITVGIMDRQNEVTGRLNGDFYGDGLGPLSGRFSARAMSGMVILTDEYDREIIRSPWIRLKAHNDSTFTLFHVTIGKSFHWERKEEQTFQGDMVIKSREDGTITAINEIRLEDYLKSVVSSEMSATAPEEFLKAHAILSRSWLLAALDKKKKTQGISTQAGKITEKEGEIIRWYEQEDHDLFDVCADDHCQRYHGITKIISNSAEEAVRETCGQVLMYRGEICDARYSKACGGITEDFETAWDDRHVPYLTSISDGTIFHHAIRTEKEATRWILYEPEAYCNTNNLGILEKILPDFDLETKGFFRWTITYPRKELEEILKEKSGIDFGVLKEIQPLGRGPSGRIFRLKIVGSKISIVAGKELEIRRWLSRTHLYSSAFIVNANYNSHGEVEQFTFHGAGWGHGVGLCQIGAAVMANKGFRTEEILRHYFSGTEIKKIY